MAGVSKQVIEEIRFKNDIVDVIGSYLTLKRAGTTFKTLCPFHKEKTPSFSINPDRQIFHCFGCGEGGDVFKFVMLHEGLDFPGALRLLADRAGIRLEFEDDDGKSSERRELYSMLEQVAQFYHRILTQSPVGEEARKYLVERKLDDETVKNFLIGYVPDRWDSVVIWGKKHKSPIAQLEAGGLVLKSTKAGSGSRYYDRFRHRIMFPICDSQGRVVGFSGRVMASGNEQAKYVNTPETAVFQKGKILYGMHKARRDIVEKREAIICEGQIDVIRCHQAGVSTAVAAQGTAFTADHARVVKRSADSAVIIFDSDKAGQTAAIRTAGELIAVGLAVRIAQLPEGEDPDSFILKNGAAGFEKLIAEAVPAVEFQVGVLKRSEDTRTEAGMMRVVRAVLGTINLAPSEMQQEKMRNEANDFFGELGPGVIEHEQRRMKKQSWRRDSERSEEDAVGPTSEDKPIPKEEVELAEHVVGNVEVCGLVEKYLPLEMISDARCSSVIAAAIEASQQGTDLLSVVGGRDDSSRSLSAFVARLQMAPAKTMSIDVSRGDAVKDLILFIRRREVKRKRTDLAHRIRKGSGEAIDTLRMEHAELTADLKALRQWDNALPLLELETGANGPKTSD